MGYIKAIQVQLQDGSLFENDLLGPFSAEPIETPSQIEFSALQKIQNDAFEARKDALKDDRDALRRLNSSVGFAEQASMFIFRQKLVISVFSSMIGPLTSTSDVDTRNPGEDQDVSTFLHESQLLSSSDRIAAMEAEI